MSDVTLLIKKASALISGVPHLISNLSNLSSLLYHSLDSVNWVGFYLLEDGKLVLGPFQGKVACIEIPLGKGVCGTAAKEDRTVAVPDVHSFEGHIACDPDSRSEIVLPLHKDGKLFGVLDIDSNLKGRFSDKDKPEFEEFVTTIEKELFKKTK